MITDSPKTNHFKTLYPPAKIELLEIFAVVQSAQFVPRLLGQPGGGVDVRIIQPHTTCQKKHPFSHIYGILTFQEVYRQQQGKQQFVLKIEIGLVIIIILELDFYTFSNRLRQTLT